MFSETKKQPKLLSFDQNSHTFLMLLPWPSIWKIRPPNLTVHLLPLNESKKPCPRRSCSGGKVWRGNCRMGVCQGRDNRKYLVGRCIALSFPLLPPQALPKAVSSRSGAVCNSGTHGELLRPTPDRVLHLPLRDARCRWHCLYAVVSS